MHRNRVEIVYGRVSRCTCESLAVHLPGPRSFDGLRILDGLPARFGKYGWSDRTSQKRSRKYELVKSIRRVRHVSAHCTSPSVSSKRQRIVERLEVKRCPS